MSVRFVFLLVSFVLLSIRLVAQEAMPNYVMEDYSNALDTAQTLTDDDLPEIDYFYPRTYEIAAISISGENNYDETVLIGYSGLRIGEKITIPSDASTNVVKRFWKQGLFSNVKLEIAAVRGNRIWLNIHLDQRPKISKINITGVKKKEREEIEKGMGLAKGSQITPYLIDKAKRFIENYFLDKGYYYSKINIQPREENGDETIVDIQITKGKKVKVNRIYFTGNKEVSTKTLDKAMKKTNDRTNILNMFRNKKFLPNEYANDKLLLIDKYNELGFRDAEILADSVVADTLKKSKYNEYVNVYVHVNEGQRYYFRNISWVGNTVYDTEYLHRVLGIKKGDVYNQKKLSERLTDDEFCVSSLYLDNGYLFFNMQPYETNIVGDSIDLEIRISEGQQARINRVNIEGSDYLYEHVVRRELRTKPGDLFSKSDIMRSMRELASTGHFSAEPGKMDIRTVPDPENGTVDLTYVLESKRNDQIELSAGWGQTGVVGILKLKFTNFSLKNLFNFKKYKPLPQGDGQTLTLSAQTNAMYYQQYSLSFVEPWLGGKRPNTLSFSIYYSIQSGMSNTYSPNYSDTYYGDNSWYSYDYDPDKYIKTLGVNLGIGTRLNWPDDYFTLFGQISYLNYNLSHWDYFALTDGVANNLNFQLILARNSMDQPIYPRRGSDVSLSFAFTLPYSAWDGIDYSKADQQTKYKWIEYYKIKFKSRFFVPLTPDEKLVLMGRAEFGFLGYYDINKRSPFETFWVGGDGMSGYNSTYATETVALRGYPNGSLTPYYDEKDGGGQAGNIYTRFSIELRYPIVMKESTMVWLLGFAEAGNCWRDYKDFNPVDLKRSAGVGLRVYMPMFGLLGVDWAYGFDEVNGRVSGSQFHFVLGQEF